MKEKKDIENLFREKFKTLDREPSPRVWENIKKELQSEKKRRIIPLWIKLGGVAALLTLFFTIGNSLLISPEERIEFETPIVTRENSEENKILYTDGFQESVKEKIVKENAFDEDDKTDLTPIQKDAVVSSRANLSEEAGIRNNTVTVPSKTQEGIAKGNPVSDTSYKKDIVETNSISTPKEGQDSQIVKTEKTADKVLSEKETSEKPSLFDAIADNEKLKEDAQTDEAKKKRWMVSPNLAPVYYNSLSGGSSVDPDLALTHSQGDVNMSYGINVSYAVSNRLNIRAGIHSVDLSYSTSDIVLATGPASRGLNAVNYKGQETVLTAVRKDNNQLHGLNIKSESGDARLIQTINYVEIPLELSYTLIDSRFGLNVIGGVSTLFLGANDISVKSSDFSMELGPANNLSDLSFSTNIGLGMNYRLNRSFNFNIEPMFKYQLNPYSDSSVNFKPYYLGIYSGLSFKF